MLDSMYGQSMPGVRAVIETIESSPWWGGFYGSDVSIPAYVAGSARDASHTDRTWHLRSGLVMSFDASDMRWHVYDPTASGAKGIAAGILPIELKMTDTEGSNVDRPTRMIVAGQIRPDALFGFDQAARASLSERGFIFGFYSNGALDPIGTYMAVRPRGRSHKTANYTILATEHGTEFTNTGATGAITLTLPALSTAGINGTTYWVSVIANQSVTVAAAGSDNIVTFNNAAATSIAVTTTDEKIGTKLRFEAVGGKWHVYDQTLR